MSAQPINLLACAQREHDGYQAAPSYAVQPCDQLRLLETALRCSREAVVLVTVGSADTAGPAVVFVNPAFTELTGFRSQDLVGQSVRLLVHPHNDPAALERLSAELRLSHSASAELLSYRKDGGQQRLDLHFQPAHTAAGLLTHWIIGVRAVDQRSAADRAVQQAQKLESLGRLTIGVTHDFNNLLTAVIGYADLALFDGKAPPPLQDDLIRIRQVGQRGAMLTRQLLSFASQQPLPPKLADLSELVDVVASFLRPLIQAQISLRLNLAAGPVPVNVDAGQIEQVLLNLALNACDALTAGGELTITTASRTLTEQLVAEEVVLPAGEYAVLIVADNGCGMTSQVRSHIFDPFFTTKPHGLGTGLGLATCQAIVKQHRGGIVCTSSVGVGTTFQIYLPSSAAELELDDNQAEIAALPGGSELILLVEDHPVVREVTGRCLRAQGYRVLAAGDGAQALQLAAGTADRIELLLADLLLPQVGGLELAQRLRELHPALRVLHMTGYPDPGQQLASPADQAALLHKPFAPAALLSAVRAALDGDQPGS